MPTTKKPYGTKSKIVRTLRNWRAAPVRELVQLAQQTRGVQITPADVYSARRAGGAQLVGNRVRKRREQAGLTPAQVVRLGIEGSAPSEIADTFAKLAVRLGLDRARTILDALEARMV